ncbi:MAG: hypothetical protein AABX70_06110 [Nanoarchaeota archaeon]
MKPTRKGQIEIGETIVVIFILMILIVFGLVFYYQFQSTSFQQTKQRFGGLKTVELAQVVSNMPELQCSNLKVAEVSCIDEVKAKQFANYLATPGNKAFFYYREILGTSKIRVRIVYPVDPASPPEANLIVVYDNSKGYKNAEPTFIPINLYNPIQKTYQFALLEATRYYS